MSQKYIFTNKKRNSSSLLVLFFAVLVVAACGGAASTALPQQQAPAGDSVKEKDAVSAGAMSGQEEMADGTRPEDEVMASKEEMPGEAMPENGAMAEDEAMADEAMAGGETMELPDWFETELTNVNTGESFKMVDFRDRIVLVETMAVWCSNCLRQQREVQALHELLGDQPNLVSVALDIDPNETNDVLAAHTGKHGFDWVYAVAPAGVAREIGQLYGGQFLNPPATPMLIIDRHGQVHPLPFGHKTALSLQEALAPFLNEVEG